VRTAFTPAPEPLALDGLVLQLAQGLLRSDAASLKATLRCRVDQPAVERGRDFLRSRLTVVQSSEVEAITTPGRYVKLCAASAGNKAVRPAGLEMPPA
jgi:hypothetical protein